MSSRFSRQLQKGFTLIELMISVAIVAILAAVAIPAYFTYIEEAAIQTTLFNVKTMQVSVEEFRLYDPSGQYPNGTFNNAQIDNQIGWNPGNMGTKFNYTLVSRPNNYDIFATNLTTSGDDGNPVWARCENYGQIVPPAVQQCCFSDNPGATGPAAACP